MGRELRRVVPNWEHPKMPNGKYQPMYNENIIDSLEERMKDIKNFINKKGDDYEHYDNFKEFLIDQNLVNIDIDYYEPAELIDEEKTWFQIYETVSEGTPISPPFETVAELIEWMATNKDYWDYQWTREQVENFINSGGNAPSLISKNGSFVKGYEQL